MITPHTISGTRQHAAQATVMAQLYDACAERYLSKRGGLWDRLGDTPIKTALRLLRQHPDISTGIKISDIGCGGGHDLEIFAKELPPKLVSQMQLVGVDASPAMIAECGRRGIHALQGDFRDHLSELAESTLVWSNFGLIHLPPTELEPVIRSLVTCACARGIVALSFKTGDDVFRVDPADERIPVDRPTTFHQIESVQQHLENAGCRVVASVHIPSENDAVYDYCWLFSIKQS